MLSPEHNPIRRGQRRGVEANTVRRTRQLFDLRLMATERQCHSIPAQIKDVGDSASDLEHAGQDPHLQRFSMCHPSQSGVLLRNIEKELIVHRAAFC